MGVGLRKKIILVNTIQRDGLAAFAFDDDLRDFVAIANDVHFGAMYSVACSLIGIFSFFCGNLDVFQWFGFVGACGR